MPSRSMRPKMLLVDIILALSFSGPYAAALKPASLEVTSPTTFGFVRRRLEDGAMRLVHLVGGGAAPES